MNSKAMRYAVCLILLLGVLSMTGVAANKNRIGTSGAQELLIPVGAAGVAIGSPSAVFLKGAEGIYWNPAGLSRMSGGVEAMFSSMTYMADINVTYGALGVSVGEFGALGFALKSISFGNIPVTTVEFPDGTGEQYSPTFLTLGVTYSKLLTDRISVGLTANIVSEQILSMSATGLAFDLGIQYHNLGMQGLMIAIGVKNIGPNMKFDGSNAYVQAVANNTNRGLNPYKSEMSSFEMPTMMEIGIAYSPKFDEVNHLTLGANFRNNNYLDDEYGLGGEYAWKDLVFLRGGYIFSPQADKDLTGASSYIYDWTLGGGLHYTVGGVGLSVDYAYRNMKYFDGNHTITFGVKF